MVRPGIIINRMRRVLIASAPLLIALLPFDVSAPVAQAATPHATGTTTGAFINVLEPDGTSRSYQFASVVPTYDSTGILTLYASSGPESLSLTIDGQPPVPGSYTLGEPGMSGSNVSWFGSIGCRPNPIDLRAGVQINEVAIQGTHVTQAAVQFGLVGECAGATQIIEGSIAFDAANTTPGQGYYLYGPDGSLAGFGNDSYLTYLGDPTVLDLNQPIVGMATTPDYGGYWMVASDGGIFAYGDAPFDGSMGGRPLTKPIVGIAATPDGNGYWLVASDGGIFSFGDAPFYGSMGGRRLNKPIVGMAPTTDGRGYWLVASDGGIFAFGDAAFHGSMGATHLNQPIVGMAATPDGNGYWMVAADGGVFAFNAPFYGSMGGRRLNKPIVGIAATPDGNGYWMVAADGGVFAFNAPFDGGLGGTGTSGVVGVSL
jgi:hypothetical protein